MPAMKLMEIRELETQALLDQIEFVHRKDDGAAFAFDRLIRHIRVAPGAIVPAAEDGSQRHELSLPARQLRRVARRKVPGGGALRAEPARLEAYDDRVQAWTA